MRLASGEPDAVRRWRIAAWLLCVVGAAARIAAYAQNRSLWYDEAALALNIARRGFVDLVAPLDFLQAAPPLFLWAERAMVLLFGVNEWALRVVPLVCGILTAPMMWRVARRLLSAPVAVLAVALVALSPTLVRYAAEVKPYASDALVTLLILDQTIAAAQGRSGIAEWRRLALVGLAAIVSSTPSVFVLAGVIAFMVSSALLAKDPVWGRRAIALAVLWGGTFGVLLATVFRPLLGEDTPIGKYMHWYWAANFLTPDPPGLAAKFSALLWAALTNTFLGDAAFRGATTVLVSAVLVGVVVLLAVRKTPQALLLTVPIVSLAVAATVRRYPIAERLILFAAPLSALIIAASQLAFSHRRVVRVRGWLTGTLTAVVVVLAAWGAVMRLESDVGRQESRALAREADRTHATGVPVWISGGGEAAWRFYTNRVSSPELTSKFGGRALAADMLLGEWYNAGPERILTVRDDTVSAARPSTWSRTEAIRVRSLSRPCALLFLTQTQPDEAVSLLSSVRQIGGRVRESRRAPGAEVYHVCFAQADS